MALAEAFQSAATIGATERFLASDSTTATYQTTDGVYQLFLDLSALANGDEFLVKAYEKVSSAGSAVAFAEWVVSHAQSVPGYVTPSVILLHGWEFSLTKLAGTDRSITWSIRKAG